VNENELAALVRYLYELGHLKRSKRTGWWLPGIRDPESVAEHTFRTALIGYLLALTEGADSGRTALLCLVHDTPETRVGDIPSVGRRYLKEPPAEDIVADQVAGLPEHLARAIQDLVAEYEAQESVEARLARDADKLECLLQAREYQSQGYQRLAPWIETSNAAVRSVVAKRIAAAAREVAPGEWWRRFAETFLGRRHQS
jgi:putative hydrolases of HD superfamily